MGGKAHRPSIRLKALNDPEWRIYPSVIGLSVNKRSRALLSTLMRHFDGGGAWLTRRCLCEGGDAARLP